MVDIESLPSISENEKVLCESEKTLGSPKSQTDERKQDCEVSSALKRIVISCPDYECNQKFRVPVPSVKQNKSLELTCPKCKSAFSNEDAAFEMFVKGREFYDSEDNNAALECFENAFLLSGYKDAHALQWTGIILSESGRYEEALPYFQQAVVLFAFQQSQKLKSNIDENGGTYHWLGTTLFRLGRYEEARKNLEKAHEKLLKEGLSQKEEMVSGTILWLCKALQKLGEFEKALGLLDENLGWLDETESEIDLKKERDELRQTIMNATPVEPVTEQKSSIYESNIKERFAAFAESVCNSRQTITIELKDAWQLVLAVEEALTRVKGLDSHKAFQTACEDIILACPNCGEYNDSARNQVLLGGRGGAIDQMKVVIYGGPNVAALGQGRCPGCNGTKVMATFEALSARNPHEFSMLSEEVWSLCHSPSLQQSAKGIYEVLTRQNISQDTHIRLMALSRELAQTFQSSAIAVDLLFQESELVHLLESKAKRQVKWVTIMNQSTGNSNSPNKDICNPIVGHLKTVLADCKATQVFVIPTIELMQSWSVRQAEEELGPDYEIKLFPTLDWYDQLRNLSSIRKTISENPLKKRIFVAMLPPCPWFPLEGPPSATTCLFPETGEAYSAIVVNYHMRRWDDVIRMLASNTGGINSVEYMHCVDIATEGNIYSDTIDSLRAACSDSARSTILAELSHEQLEQARESNFNSGNRYIGTLTEMMNSVDTAVNLAIYPATENI